VLHVKVLEPQFEGRPRPSWATPRSRARQDRRQRAAGLVARRAPAGGAEHHREGRERGPGPRGGARRATGAEEVRARERGASGKLADCSYDDPALARSTWSRATRPAAAPSRRGSASSRRSSPSEGRSSTSRRRGSTRSSATRRSAP
jgi:hypothetical protein